MLKEIWFRLKTFQHSCHTQDFLLGFLSICSDVSRMKACPHSLNSYGFFSILILRCLMKWNLSQNTLLTLIILRCDDYKKGWNSIVFILMVLLHSFCHI
jgi:hypothetical protein